MLLLWGAVALLIAARRPEPAPYVPDPAPPGSDAGLTRLTIDLNRDPWPRLTLIEGVGETLALRIVTAREERGGFTTLEEVMALPGIPDGVIERARPWLVLGPAILDDTPRDDTPRDDTTLEPTTLEPTIGEIDPPTGPPAESDE